MQAQACKQCGKQLARYNGVPGDDDQWYHLEKERPATMQAKQKE